MPGLTNNLSGSRKFGKKTLCARKVRLQAATVMKVAPGILLLLIGELESIFQDSNRREAKTEKQKEKNPSILFFFLSFVDYFPFIRLY